MQPLNNESAIQKRIYERSTLSVGVIYSIKSQLEEIKGN